MKNLTLFLILSTFSCSIWAKDTSANNQYWATKYASWASQIKKPKDVILRLPLSSRSQKLISNRIAQDKRLGSVKVTIRQLSPSKIEFVDSTKNKIEMDFRSYHKRELYVNKKIIKLSKNKTFLNYQSEIRLHLNRKKKAAVFLRHILLHEANAEISDFMSSFLAFFVTSAADVTNQPSLEDNLIDRYRKDAEEWKRYAEQRNDDPFLNVHVFNCKGENLGEVYEAVLVYKGEINKPDLESDRIIRTDGGGYIYRGKYCGESVISPEGIVLKANKGCPAVSQDIFSMPPFFNFPLVAEKCCKKKGCYAKVSNALTEIQKNHILTPGNKQDAIQ